MRRRFIQGSLGVAGLAVLGGCGRLPWQAQPKMPRIGFISAGSSERDPGFRQALEELGYIDGRTATIEWRDPAGQSDRVPDLAAELVHLPVDILVTDGGTATRAAKDATSTIPIV